MFVEIMIHSRGGGGKGVAGSGREGGGGEGGRIRRLEVQVAAHFRTCTRLLKVSATTMSPLLSMAMPPQTPLNCRLLEPSPPMVRTWAPSL